MASAAVVMTYWGQAWLSAIASQIVKPIARP